jgi:hypothetical protein
VFAAACGTGDVTDSTRPLPLNPLFDIQDGANSGGNPDFFFLPPMVDNPSGNANFLNNGFNSGLAPKVTITKNGGAVIVLPATSATLNVDHYSLNWQVPVSSASTTYRVTISVGSTNLGFADILASSNNAELKNADNTVVPLKDGRTLPIKFVIENCALIAGECSSKIVNLTQGGTVTIPKGGVEIPAQPSGGSTRVTVSTCPDIPSDLLRFGSCVRVLANPGLTAPLNVPAEVWVCDSGINSSSSDQLKRVTMHRYDAPNTMALEHAHDQCAPSISDAGYSLKGVVAELLSGRFRSAGKQLRGVLGPRPLHATAVLDVGAGGETDGFSDFQLLLPAKMAKCGGDGLTVLAGSVISPKVCVTDLAGEPVVGATVHFSTTDGSVYPQSVVTTLSAGEAVATAAWTISTTPGPNLLVASGNGIAVAGNDGPRGVFDPFQPFPYAGPPTPESGTPLGAVDVTTGTETFNVTGVPEVSIFGFGAAGFNFLDIGLGADDAGDLGIATFAVPPTGWQTIGFVVPAGWTTNASAPFGAGCGTTPASPFPLNHDLLIRRTFTTAQSGTVEITVRIDNDAQIWLDGVNISASGVGNDALQSNGSSVEDDWWIHDGCADTPPDNIVFKKLFVPAGTHTLAVWAHDRGSVGFFDVKVTLKP